MENTKVNYEARINSNRIRQTIAYTDIAILIHEMRQVL